MHTDNLLHNIGSNYFCDTGATRPQNRVFYQRISLWDGFGCHNNNDYCSFNNPPWFYQKLLVPTEEPVVMKIWLNENSENEDLANRTNLFIFIVDNKQYF